MSEGISPLSALRPQATIAPAAPQPNLKPAKADDRAVREAFDGFVGETFYGQMLSAMRKTQGKPAYFHGGQAEEIFQGQLDQVLSEKLSKAGANSFTDSMYELFTMGRPN